MTHVIDDEGRSPEEMIRWQGEDRHLPLRLVLSFIGAEPLPSAVVDQLSAERRLKTTPLASTEPFWQMDPPLQTYPIDRRFRESLRAVFFNREYELGALPLAKYHAIDLLDYLRAQQTLGVGDDGYLVVTNLLGQEMVLSRSQLERHRPVVVVGIDDERNLFRWGVSYQTLSDYSWLPLGDDPRPMFIRPLGAFLHLPHEPSSDLFAHSYSRFGLEPGSFSWVEDDPRPELSGVDPKVVKLLNGGGGCLECHAFRRAGAMSRHVDAWSGLPNGGAALALEDYPAEPWRRFLFDQTAVAKQIGVEPLPLEPVVARKLYELVAESRSDR